MDKEIGLELTGWMMDKAVVHDGRLWPSGVPAKVVTAFGSKETSVR